MKFIKIRVEVKPEDRGKIKKLLTFLGEHRQSISVKKMVGTKNSQVVFYSFSIDSDVIADFMVKLNEVKLKVVTQEEVNDKLIYIGKRRGADKLSSKIDKISTDSISKEKQKAIEEYIAEGNYTYLMEIIKDIQAGPSNRKKAELFLPDTVKNAIAINFTKAQKGKYFAYQALIILVKIATDSKLKDLQLNYLLIKAGERALEICDLYEELTHELIKIGNNVKMPYILSLRAIVKFSNMIMLNTRDSKDGYEADVSYAVKNTNLPWLRIANDVAGSELIGVDKESFRKFMSFIEYKKYEN